ncbi:glycosyltransferase [Croceicoccus mobilis]|uniref:Glycosyl transferase family 28 C-terminal domain-containing protein n=1 Tax=Croceicoccus mobilis TaxID=1703339 RepID=A0A917DZF1_9SPHN|nr:glycosyltransferase [Croceicoccus mobilis]GGD83299.1 hypothetical protein GCM10010990_36740 [Croceicoccus mobilis]
MATLTEWFDAASPALFVTDVSAELGQLARIASVPHVAVLQHGDRSDPGHMASYDAAVGLLAPYDRALEQDDRPEHLRAKTHYAPGVGVGAGSTISREDARIALGIAREVDLVLVLAGGGGQGTPTAPLTIGARAEPGSRWIVIGETFSEWHETPPGNLELKGWVDNAALWIAAADRIVSSCGNTTVHQIAAAGRPWIVIPEWRYFGEQYAKAEALGRAGVCATQPVWPAQAADWARLWREAHNIDPENQRALVDPGAAAGAAQWLDDLATRLWAGSGIVTSEDKALVS